MITASEMSELCSAMVKQMQDVGAGICHVGMTFDDGREPILFVCVEGKDAIDDTKKALDELQERWDCQNYPDDAEERP